MVVSFQPQNLVLMSEFPHGEVKLCDLGISRYIGEGADIRDILGTPDYVGKYRAMLIVLVYS
jgi:serine/threonine kinase 17